jgi:2,3-bisphosphoglycerate-dependent phosphoglycerate mutase
MNRLVLLRHGESTWNRDNRFTGWTDVDLSELGIEEAHRSGRLLKAHGHAFDIAFTSLLKRAIRTLWIVQDEMDLMWVPVIKDWRLNERHYGALQGLNKAEMAARYGADQVHQWRRSFATRPPALEPGDPRRVDNDPRYAQLRPDQRPACESLQDTLARALPCWHETIVPAMRAGRRVLVVAHGNSLRALVKHLDRLSDAEILELNIPTGVPLVYEFDDRLEVTKRFYLRADASTQQASG